MTGEPVSIVEPLSGDPMRPLSGIERRFRTIAGVVLVHVVVLAIGAVTSVVVAKRPTTFLPNEPLLVTMVALAFAHSSMSAIWWTRSNWSPHFKTAVLSILAACFWFLLVSILESTQFRPVLGASWASGLILQMVCTTLGVGGLELTIDYEPAASRSRFNLFFLMLWTTILAVLLAVVSRFAAQNGFQLSGVSRSEYFWPLQVVGLANAGLAFVAYAGVRLSHTPVARGAVCVATVIASAEAIPLLLRVIFADGIGARTPELVWLYSAEAILLLATLIPLVTSRNEKSDRPRATAAARGADDRRGCEPGQSCR